MEIETSQIVKLYRRAGEDKYLAAKFLPASNSVAKMSNTPLVAVTGKTVCIMSGDTGKILWTFLHDAGRDARPEITFTDEEVQLDFGGKLLRLATRDGTNVND